MPYLQIADRAGRPIDRIDIDGDPFTIGRAPTNRLVLPSGVVSRRHCVIESSSGHARLLDLQSKHGTRVNEQTVRETTLRPGDRIRVGPYQLVYVQPGTERRGGEATQAGRDDPRHRRTAPSSRHERREEDPVDAAPSLILDGAAEEDEATLMTRIFTLRRRRSEDMRADRDIGAWIVAVVLLCLALGATVVLVATSI
jgi:pSer/pThr/pTyr-binding forkhead associated (FHA) protein